MKSKLIFLMPLIIFTSGCEKWALDKQMKELCAKDGGVKVYEAVTLPPEMFDQDGSPFPGWRNRKSLDRFGKDYRYERIDQVLDSGDPLKGEGRLERTEWRIVRQADQKLLGAGVAYIRVGGDFILLGHPSGAHCPSAYNTNQLSHEVFIQRGK